MSDIQIPLIFTDAAAKKVKSLIEGEDNPNLRLRVYITGGGCSGFQYGFTFDDQVNDGDLTIENQNVGLVVDPMSLQYLIGGTVRLSKVTSNNSRFIHENDKNASLYPIKRGIFYNHPFRLKYKYGEAAATIIKQIAIG